MLKIACTVLLMPLPMMECIEKDRGTIRASTILGDQIQIQLHFFCIAQITNNNLSHKAFTNYADVIPSALRPSNWIRKNIRS